MTPHDMNVPVSTGSDEPLLSAREGKCPDHPFGRQVFMLQDLKGTGQVTFSFAGRRLCLSGDATSMVMPLLFVPVEEQPHTYLLFNVKEGEGRWISYDQWDRCLHAMTDYEDEAVPVEFVPLGGNQYRLKAVIPTGEGLPIVVSPLQEAWLLIGVPTSLADAPIQGPCLGAALCVQLVRANPRYLERRHKLKTAIPNA